MFDENEDSIQEFRLSNFTDSTLVLSGNNIFYSLEEVPQSVEEVLPVETEKQMIPNAGFTFESFWRGAWDDFTYFTRIPFQQ